MKLLLSFFRANTRNKLRAAERQLSETQDKLKSLEQKFRTLSKKGGNGIIVMEKDGVVHFVAPSVTNVLGFREDQILNRDFRAFIKESDVIYFDQALAKSIGSSGVIIECDILTVRHNDGSLRCLEVNFTNHFADPEIAGIVMGFRDCTTHKIISDKLLYANRLYSFISQINQAIVHTKDEIGLFEKVCSIAVEPGGFRFAWIGIVKEEISAIEFTVSAGATQKDLDYFTSYTYDAGGPIDNVVNGEAFFVVSDIENRSNSNFIAYAHERGFKSAICLPLKKSGKVIGTLNLYSGDKHFFNPQEISLLTEATGDISFALDAFDTEIQRTIAEQKLAYSENRLKQAQEIAHLGSWEVSLATGVGNWSEEALRIYGLPTTDQVKTYQQWLSYIHPDDLSYVVEICSDSSGSGVAFFHRIIRPDGTIRYLYSQAQTERDGDGNPIAMHGIVHDVTVAKVTENALAESQTNLRHIVDTIPQAIFASDAEGNIVFANKSFASIFGLTTSGVINHNITAIPSGQHFANYLGNSMNEKVSIEPELKVTDFFQKERIFHTTKIPYTIPGNCAKAVLAIATDITQHKLAEYERSRMMSEIVRRNKDLEQFSYIVSHNLRAPVANIMGLATELEDENHSVEVKVMLQQQLTRSTIRLDSVIMDLNKILQVKTEITEEKEEVNLVDLIKEIQSSLGILLKQECVEFKLNLEVTTITSLRSYQHSIFYNLIANSIKYRRAEVAPMIEIYTTGTQNGIKIQFRDNGMGIDMSRSENQLFGLYRRFHHHVEGKGVGLFMVKTQVETLGGRISVSSEINSGTEFLIEYES